MSKAIWCAVILALAPVSAKAQATIPVDPAYKRAQALVNDGNVTAGRALVDSMIAVAAPGSNEYAEGVYWRAVLAATAADAEMDYRRIVVDFPASPRVEDALIRLAQLEIARGNYDAALRHLNRLATEHPDSPSRARAGYWSARALFDKNDLQGGCAATADALTRAGDTDA
ncbi:MAG: tetratricopeptide repeat protein, partial [Gemmatimonas sp.]